MISSGQRMRILCCCTPMVAKVPALFGSVMSLPSLTEVASVSAERGPSSSVKRPGPLRSRRRGVGRNVGRDDEHVAARFVGHLVRHVPESEPFGPMHSLAANDDQTRTHAGRHVQQRIGGIRLTGVGLDLHSARTDLRGRLLQGRVHERVGQWSPDLGRSFRRTDDLRSRTGVQAETIWTSAPSAFANRTASSTARSAVSEPSVPTTIEPLMSLLSSGPDPIAGGTRELDRHSTA